MAHQHFFPYMEYIHGIYSPKPDRSSKVPFLFVPQESDGQAGLALSKPKVLHCLPFCKSHVQFHQTEQNIIWFSISVILRCHTGKLYYRMPSSQRWRHQTTVLVLCCFCVVYFSIVLFFCVGIVLIMCWYCARIMLVFCWYFFGI